MSGEDKLLSLARLAADDRTPEHERNVAARELAKRVARGELPSAMGSTNGGLAQEVLALNYKLESIRTLRHLDQLKLQDALAEVARLKGGEDDPRTVAALEAIAKRNADELKTLRADKADLERKIKAISVVSASARRVLELEDDLKVCNDEIESLRTTGQSKQLETTTAELKRITGEWKKSLDQIAELNDHVGGSIEQSLNGSRVTSVRVENYGVEDVTGSSAHVYGRTEGPYLRLTVELITADRRLLQELQRRAGR